MVGESNGLLPSRAWKRAAFRERADQVWFPGETVIASIGQGYMLVTPLQLANATAALATRGKRFVPHLVGAFEDPISGKRTLIAPEPLPPEPLSTDPTVFWSGSGTDRDVLAEVTIPPHATPLSARLGGFPFWRGEQDFQAFVTAHAQRAAEHGLKVFLGETLERAPAEPAAPPPPVKVPKPKPARKSTAARTALKPAVPIKKSVTVERLFCLECGEGFLRLALHVKRVHDLSPNDYRRKWRLPMDYPMVAPRRQS